MTNIEEKYQNFYTARFSGRLYPTEFVLRTFLGKYPDLKFNRPPPKSRVLDVSCGDGRNTVFLCDLGYEVYGSEISAGIISETGERLSKLGYNPILRTGYNDSLPFDDSFLDCILASHSCYYCREGKGFDDNMIEYFRILKPGGSLIASVPSISSYIFDGSEHMGGNLMCIKKDPYGNRLGAKLQAFESKAEIMATMGEYFINFSIGEANNDFYGIDERVFWVVCFKPS